MNVLAQRRGEECLRLSEDSWGGSSDCCGITVMASYASRLPQEACQTSSGSSASTQPSPALLASHRVLGIQEGSISGEIYFSLFTC